jgi:hypothetical protein
LIKARICFWPLFLSESETITSALGRNDKLRSLNLYGLKLYKSAVNGIYKITRGEALGKTSDNSFLLKKVATELSFSNKNRPGIILFFYNPDFQFKFPYYK